MEERIGHQSYAPGVPWSLEYERLTVSAGLARSARDFPHQTALSYMGASVT